jgi:P-type Ca2+ transporter type 2C
LERNSIEIVWSNAHSAAISSGTLTENRMTVVEGWFAGTKHSKPPSKDQLPPLVGEEIIKNICLNSKAFYIEEPGKKTEFVGNRTECALLQLCEKEFGVPYSSIRKKHEESVKEVCSSSFPSAVPFLPAR